MSAPSRSGGFTLVEVVVATGLLVVVALGSAHLFLLAIRHNVEAKQRLAMTLLAARKIDELSAAAAAGPLPSSPPDALERDAEGFADDALEGGVRCARRWLVVPLPAYGGAVVAITVRVSVAGAGDVQIVAIAEVAGS